MPKKLKTFSLKLHKGDGIFLKALKSFWIKVLNVKKNIWEVYTQKNKNKDIKGGGSF